MSGGFNLNKASEHEEYLSLYFSTYPKNILGEKEITPTDKICLALAFCFGQSQIHGQIPTMNIALSSLLGLDP